MTVEADQSSFTKDITTLRKDHLSKSIISQLVAADLPAAGKFAYARP